MNQALIETAASPAAWRPSAEPFDSGARFLPAYRRFVPGHCLRQAKVIEARLHYRLEYPVAILDPKFQAGDAQIWQVRAAAIDFCLNGLRSGDRHVEFIASEVADLEQAAAKALDPFLARFISGLDSEVFAIASYGAGCTLLRYNYFLGTDSAIRRNRLQFQSTLPLLAPIACGELEDPPHYTGRLRQAIDEGAPLVREICSWFQLAPNVVRGLRSAP